MKTQRARVGARGIDSVQTVRVQDAIALKASGIDFCVRYLGGVTRLELEAILNAGLAFMCVTYANRFDGAQAVQQLAALALPKGATVWLDVEGQSVYNTPAPELIAKINAWAAAVKAAGFEPGIYVGSPQPLTSEELYALQVVRYWNALSREQDRNGKLAEPSCGWCMWQMHPSVMWAGVWSDVNIIGQDFQSRLPAWVVAG